MIEYYFLGILSILFFALTSKKMFGFCAALPNSRRSLKKLLNLIRINEIIGSFSEIIKTAFNFTSNFPYNFAFDLRLLEIVFRKSAHRADPILWNIFPFSTWCNAIVRVADLGIVFIAARANVFIHNIVLLILTNQN